MTRSTLSEAASRVGEWLSGLNLLKEREESMRLKMVIEDYEIFVALVDNSATRDFVARLSSGAMQLNFSDFGGSEKIAYVEPRLDITDTSGCDPQVGDLTLYTPWGNLAAFYRDTSAYSDALVLIGKIENNGIEVLAAQSGNFTVQVSLA